ncbi:MAG TPA: outer membrane protein transport protein [Candidatus Binataceae bacterium]|nr:outer membrane protein transport protein [Candidatus Binataceae bacterium]HVB82343.1 outer membrane protein transport protein [Candidatus Binataceae bacterium]
MLYEQGTPDVGLASAGQGARAQDASTVFTNPAGMTQLKDSQLLIGAEPLFGNLTFSPNAKTSVKGTNGGNAAVPMPSGSFFYVHSLSPNLKLGFGSYSYFGAPIEYNLNWIGKYHLQGATMLGMSFQPAIAFRAADWLSIGGGPDVMLGFLRAKAGVNTLNPRLGDGQVKYQDYTVNVGGNIGILLTPRDGTRIGIDYLTPVNLNFSDAPHFKGLGPLVTKAISKSLIRSPNVNLGMQVPQQLMADVYQKVTERMALLGSVGWQNWSQFGLVDIGIDTANPKSLTKNLHFQDTFHLAAGTQYQLMPGWMLSCGFAFDNSAVGTPMRTVSLPIGDQYRFGAGVQYAWSRKITLGFADEFMYQGELPVSQNSGPVLGTVAGQFTNTFINFFSLNLIYKFGTD